MRQILILLILVLFGSSSCRKLVWDNPNDTSNPKTEPASLKDGLVAFYPFNGNANDESGNNNQGEVFGAKLSTDRFNRSNKAFQFEGTSSSYIETIRSGPSQSDISVSYWYNEGTAKEYAGYLFQYGGDTWGTYFSAVNNWWPSGSAVECYGPGFVSGGTGISKKVSMNPDPSKWHHVVIILPTQSSDIKSVKIFLNGIELIQECSFANYGAPAPNVTATRPIRFGKSWEFPDKFFYKGKLDDICFYNRALTQEEITYLANN